MFNQDNLQKVSKAEDFGVWLYTATDREDANHARHMLGYFPEDSGFKPQDAVYVKGGGTLTLHWVERNQHEGNKITLQILGG